MYKIHSEQQKYFVYTPSSIPTPQSQLLPALRAVSLEFYLHVSKKYAYTATS